MDLVHVTYDQTENSKSTNAFGLRKMYDLSLVDIIYILTSIRNVKPLFGELLK